LDDDTLKDVEHLLDDQLANIRQTYDDAIRAGCADPVVWLFNLELRDSLEVACGTHLVRAQGETLQRIADRLNLLNQQTRRRRPWNHVQVKRVLDRAVLASLAASA
jgi:hypothetical protein